MPEEGIVLGGREAAALARAHVQQRGARRFAQRRERVDQRFEVVSVDRAGVAHAQRLCVAAHVAAARETADVRRDRHAVVVVDDAQRRSLVGELAGVIQRLEGHARGRGAVADHGDHLRRVAAAAQRLRDAERRRHGGARVACTEHVEAALAAPQEAARAVLLADPRERLAAARQHFVSVGLMADVPDHAVGRRVEDVVQRNGEFDGAEAAGEVTAARCTARNQLFAQRRCGARQHRARQPPEISRLTNLVEQRHTPQALSMDVSTLTPVTCWGKRFR